MSVRVMTPGTLKKILYCPRAAATLTAVSMDAARHGVGLIECSTGEFIVAEIHRRTGGLIRMSFRLNPSEVVIAKTDPEHGLHHSLAPRKVLHCRSCPDEFSAPAAQKRSKSLSGTVSLRGFRWKINPSLSVRPVRQRVT